MTKKIEGKEGLPAEILYQTIAKGGFTFKELAKWLKHANKSMRENNK